MRAGSRTVATGAVAADVGAGGHARLGGLGGGNSEGGAPGGGDAGYGGTGVAGGARTGGPNLRPSPWTTLVPCTASQAQSPAPATPRRLPRRPLRTRVPSQP